jgi:hypothetical protein
LRKLNIFPIPKILTVKLVLASITWFAVEFVTDYDMPFVNKASVKFLAVILSKFAQMNFLMFSSLSSLDCLIIPFES